MYFFYFCLWGYVKECIFFLFLCMGLRQGSDLCSSSSRKYPGAEGCYILQTVWNELDYRVDVCRITKDEYIEHL